MKILEAQSAVMTNVEVYAFLSNQAKQYEEQKRKGPANLETLRKEVRRDFLFCFCLYSSLYFCYQVHNVMKC